MLKVHHFCIGLGMMSFDPKKGLGMSISRFSWVTLVFHTLFFDHLLKVFVVIWISASFVNINTSVDIVEKWRFSRIITLNEALRQKSIIYNSWLHRVLVYLFCGLNSGWDLISTWNDSFCYSSDIAKRWYVIKNIVAWASSANRTWKILGAVIRLIRIKYINFILSQSYPLTVL